mmetsp:Transcript_4428/g.9727  ORF Transcript_4428/g.9727 Transcript_4428/m.9727 type:complete len:776 (+) Transcript_4428:3-2330(+)
MLWLCSSRVFAARYFSAGTAPDKLQQTTGHHSSNQQHQQQKEHNHNNTSNDKLIIMSAQDDKGALKQAFVSADLNGDGQISRHELRQLLQAVTALKPAEIDLMFDQFDTDGDGQLNYDEFVEWLMADDQQTTKKKVQETKSLRRTVTIFDVSEGMDVIVGKGPDEGKAGKVIKITGSGNDKRYRVELGDGKATWTTHVKRFATDKEAQKLGQSPESTQPVVSPLMAALNGGTPAGKGGPKGGGKGAPPPAGSKAAKDAEPDPFPENTNVEVLVDPHKGKLGTVLKITGEGKDKKYRVQIEAGGPACWVAKVGKAGRELKQAVKTLQIEDLYEIEKKKLGTGAFGSVSKARNRATGLVRAMKNIRKPMVKNVQLIYKEIEFMKKFDHPNIIKVYDHFEDARSVYLIMELCTGGELFDRIVDDGAFTEVQAASVLKQILRGLFHMHSKQVCHRDLKPENFLLTCKEPLDKVGIKIIDFGISHDFPAAGETLRSKVGSSYYVAPEVLQARYNESADMWSFGVITYIVLSGSPPFNGETDDEVEKKVAKGVWSFEEPIWQQVSPDAKNFISNLIVLDWQSGARLDAARAMEHVWIDKQAPHGKPTKLDGALANLKAFQSSAKMKKIALQVIANQCSDEQLSSLRETFQALDTNGDGFLTLEEIKKGIETVGLSDVPELQKIIEQVDFNNSGKLDYTEFLGASLDRKVQMQEDICWGAFRVFDKNGDGKISKEELSEVLKSADIQNIANGDVEKMIQEVDGDSDGMVDFKEFMAMMKTGA